MKKFNFEKYGDILIDAIIMAVGIIFLINFTHAQTVIYILSIIILFISLITELFRLFKNKKKVFEISSLLGIFIYLIFAAFIISFPNLFFNFIHIVVGWWILLNAAIAFVSYYAYRIDNEKGTSFLLIKGIAGLIIGVILIIRPTDKLWILSLVAGIYLIVFSAFELFNQVIALMPNKQKNFLTRYTSVSLPVLFNTLIPRQVYMSTKSLIKANQLTTTDKPSSIKPSDLEVFIYLKEKGPESLGHVDICFNGMIYSYGCHDPKTWKLMGTMGDGVLIVCKRDPFLEQAVLQDHKMVIGYSIKLTEDEKKIIQGRIDKLMERTVPWDCPYVAAVKKGEDTSKIDDYASKVYMMGKCDTYKFTSGKFKTYFVASTNCVLLADDLIRSKDLSLINVSGIVVPGTYLKFLNTELHSEESSVIACTIYKD